jgi:multicomponent Na+:H+ antiporter subunit D
MGGFTSKWKIASAALSGGPGLFAVLGPVVLLISALLTAGYLFPVVINAFFPGANSEEDFEEETEDTIEEKEFAEPGVLMDGAMIVLCIAALLAGLFGAGIVGGLVL